MTDVDLLRFLSPEEDNIFQPAHAISARWGADAEYAKYLGELTASSADRLRHEPEHIAREQKRILQETQELAFRSYKGFIQTADSSKEIFSEFLTVSKNVGDMLDKLPALSDHANAFVNAAPSISQRRKVNLHILQHHAKLLELLEIPQLMDTLVRGGHYEEALDLDAHMARMARKHGDVAVIRDIAAEVKRCTRSMLAQLLQLLRGDMNLPSCLRVVGHIRRLAAFSEPELRLKFLHARGSWLRASLQAIDPTDPYTLLNKSIDVFRLGVSDIISQYRAVFSGDADSASLLGADAASAQLYGWGTATVSQFLGFVQTHLPRITEGALLHSLMDQCVYLGQLLGRVGLDCRPLLIPAFEEAVVALYTKTVGTATDAFVKEVAANPRLLCTPAGTSASARGLSAVSDYTQAATLVNAYIDALNNLRHCAPLSVAHRLSAYTEEQLLQASTALAVKFHDYVDLHGEDDPHLRDRYLQLCEVWALDGVPFVARSFSTVYSPGSTSAAAPMPAVDLKKPAALLEPIYHARLKGRADPTQPIELAVPHMASMPSLAESASPATTLTDLEGSRSQSPAFGSPAYDPMQDARTSNTSNTQAPADQMQGMPIPSSNSQDVAAEGQWNGAFALGEENGTQQHSIGNDADSNVRSVPEFSKQPQAEPFRASDVGRSSVSNDAQASLSASDAHSRDDQEG